MQIKSIAGIPYKEWLAQNKDEDEEEDKGKEVEVNLSSSAAPQNLIQIKGANFTPRIPRKLVESYFEKIPEHAKTLGFIYSYSYKAVKEGKYSAEENGIYKGISISLKDVALWFGPHRKRWIEKFNDLKKNLQTFNFNLTEKELLVDLRILINQSLDYLAELSKKEAKLSNTQYLFLKRVQAGSRATGTFNLSTLVEFRSVGCDTRLRRMKQKTLADLKLFQEMGFFKKVAFLSNGKQVKLMIWKEQKAGVGKRQKRKKK